MKKTTTYFKHEGKVSGLPTKVFKNQEEMLKYRAKHRALERVATGIGYKHSGKSYEYPIKDKKHLDIVKRVGGKIKE